MSIAVGSIRPYPEERRLATVLFADILGFTELAEQMDFEDISDLTKDIWHWVDALLEQYGGYIDKHIGDAVMAVWGAPRAGADDAEQAVTAALALQAALPAYVTHTGQIAVGNLQMRVGLHTGPVMAGYIGIRNEYTVMGATVNVANRLEASAEPGAVVISESTYQQVRGAFRVRDLAPLKVKGKIEPLVTYRVDGPQTSQLRARYRGGAGLETRMVARDEEMARLLAFYQHARAQQQPEMVCLEGEAGLGKSRLIMEFTRKLQLNEPGLFLLSARCQHQFRRAPFYMWKSLWFDILGLTDAGPPEVMRAKFVRAVQELWGRRLGPVSSVDAAHFIGSLAGLDWPDSAHLAAVYSQPPAARLQHALELTRELLRRMAAGRPILMALDDLQWMDVASRDLLLGLLAPGPEPLPLLIVGGIRAEPLGPQPQLAQATTVIRLKALPITTQTVASAYPRLAAWPEPVLLALAERAAGNPYFLEEMVRSLFAGNQNVQAGQLSADELNHLLPASLQAVLQARLDELAPDARAVVLLASVVGRVFWTGALQALAQQVPGTGLLGGERAEVPERIRRALITITQAEFAFPRATSVFSGQQEYIFKHSLLRDVAYSLLPHKHLRQYHLAVARWLAARTRPDMAATVGAHLEAAGDYAAAAEHYAQTARYAVSRGADDEAAWLSARALTMKDQPAGTGAFGFAPPDTGTLGGAGETGRQPGR